MSWLEDFLLFGCPVLVLDSWTRLDFQQLRHQASWAHGGAIVHPVPLPGADVPKEGPQSAPIAMTLHRVLITRIPQRLLQDRLKGSAGAGGLIAVSQQGCDICRGHDGPVVALPTTATAKRPSCSQGAARTPSSAAIRAATKTELPGPPPPPWRLGCFAVH